MVGQGLMRLRAAGELLTGTAFVLLVGAVIVWVLVRVGIWH